MMLTTSEYAVKHGTSRRNVLAMIQNGRLKAERFGKAWMIAEDAIPLPPRPAGAKPNPEPDVTCLGLNDLYRDDAVEMAEKSAADVALADEVDLD